MSRQRQPLRLAILEAERILAAAGVAAPGWTPKLIAAHVLGVERGRLPMVPLVDPPVVDAIGQLVAQRAKRVPLQHLTGWAAMGGITVGVGPGVFVPRPETELLLEWGCAGCVGVAKPVVVDLCTGSGRARAGHGQRAAGRHRARGRARCRRAGVGAAERRTARAGRRHPDPAVRGRRHRPEPVPNWTAPCDLVLCNPPYVPDGTAGAARGGRPRPEAAVFAVRTDST